MSSVFLPASGAAEQSDVVSAGCAGTWLSAADPFAATEHEWLRPYGLVALVDPKQSLTL